ncbi:hypothetical protein AQUSIP_13990 [Aquicella siphonis]|uniref:Type IV pilus modification protein PilV n=2 Tax=Aquicella siphonis TaxID=254247 RepID=A0A5E4PGT8_9COXI|nr:hypothetical protein AQUSIP_13990 [Aquicella siphonis]
METHTGTSLIEVMISLFILSVMLLGVEAVQIISLKKSLNAYYLAVAVRQLDVMHERLRRANEVDLKDWLIAWNTQNQASLPEGKGEITGVIPDLRITLCWRRQHDFGRNNPSAQTTCLYA